MTYKTPTQKSILAEMKTAGYKCKKIGTYNNASLYAVSENKSIFKDKIGDFTISMMMQKFLGY